MNTAQQKVVVLKQRDCDTVAIDVTDRDFWMSMRHALLQQLATIEKKLGLSRRCRNCGHDLASRTG
jgi:hypothetical protein